MKGGFWYLLTAVVVLILMYWGVVIIGNIFVTLIDICVGIISTVINLIASFWMSICVFI